MALSNAGCCPSDVTT
jgi:enolase